MYFPYDDQYIKVVQQRDRGVMMIAIIAFAGLTWLWLGRFNFPRLLPVLRVATVLLFFVTLAYVLISEVVK
jgi:hypothetical protein